MVDGVVIKPADGVVPIEEASRYETYHIERAPKQISRRAVGRTFGRFGRIHFDLIQLPPAYKIPIDISLLYRRAKVLLDHNI